MILQLEAERLRRGVDILFARNLLQYWSDGTVKRHIVFESVQGAVHPNAEMPPEEPAMFLAIRWNPFNGLYVMDPEIIQTIPREIVGDASSMLRYAREKGYTMHVSDEFTATERLRAHDFSLRSIIQANRFMRTIGLSGFTILKNIERYVITYPAFKRYKKRLKEMREKKILILDLQFGGLGDCLALTSLPRLLAEQYGVDFYLSEESKQVFRHSDIARLCFEMNPYFKGYRSGDALQIQRFVQDAGLWTILTDRSSLNLTEALEREFGLVGSGLPEIYYKPKMLPGYERTLLCDTHWITGEKAGLYNDPSLLQAELDAWVAEDRTNRIEYITPTGQDIFAYADKLHSCARFVCFFSGGNMLAVALRIPAIVIVPENIEGQSLSQFLFRGTGVKYRRKRPITGYGPLVIDS